MNRSPVVQIGRSTIRGRIAWGATALLWLMTIHAAICPAGSKGLTVAVGMAIPPYNIPEMDSGIEMDIVREALGGKGYVIQAKYVPFGRVKRELMDGEVDAALTINPDSGIEAFYSDEHLICQNVVVTLQKNHFRIRSVDDLKERSVLAFQDARLYLGKAFASMASHNDRYKEIAKQELQINLLYTDRVDAIVLDKNIFSYYRNRNDMVDVSQPVDVWQIFPPTPFRVAFMNRQVRDDFNEGLKRLRESGRYDEIVRKYITR